MPASFSQPSPIVSRPTGGESGGFILKTNDGALIAAILDRLGDGPHRHTSPVIREAGYRRDMPEFMAWLDDKYAGRLSK